jgi:hypothetical protein
LFHLSLSTQHQQTLIPTYLHNGKFWPESPSGIILLYSTSYATLWDRHEITINCKFDLHTEKDSKHSR